MKKLVIFFLFLASIAQASSLNNITPSQLQEMIDKNIPVIDIRTPPEWKQLGVVPTSHKIMFFDEQGKYDVQKWLDQLATVIKNPTDPFILVCRSGNRTGTVGKFLAGKLQFKKVYHLQHGIKSWIKEGRKTIK